MDYIKTLDKLVQKHLGMKDIKFFEVVQTLPEHILKNIELELDYMCNFKSVDPTHHDYDYM